MELEVRRDIVNKYVLLIGSISLLVWFVTGCAFDVDWSKINTEEPDAEEVGGIPCVKDSECGRNRVCEDGKCKNSPPCINDNDCKGDRVCEGYMCVSLSQIEEDKEKDSGEDGKDDDDNDDDLPDAGEEDKGALKDCQTSDDCPGGKYCDYGKCYTGSGKECAVSKDCPVYEECVLLKCRRKHFEQGELWGECYSDKSCDAGLICVNDICVEDKDTDGEDVEDVGDDDDDIPDSGEEDIGDTTPVCESDCSIAGQRICFSATEYQIC